MTAPISFAGPSVSTAGAAAGGTGSTDGAPTFSSALDDALTGGGSSPQSGQTAATGTAVTTGDAGGPTPPDVVDDSDQGPVPDAATLPGGTWALLMASLGLSTTPPQAPAGDDLAARTGAGAVGAAGPSPAGAGPTRPGSSATAATAATTPPAEPLPATAAPVAPAPGAAGAAAATAGLTVVTAAGTATPATAPSTAASSTTASTTASSTAPPTGLPTGQSGTSDGGVPLLPAVTAGSAGTSDGTSGGPADGGPGTPALPIAADEPASAPGTFGPAALGAPAPGSTAAAAAPPSAPGAPQPPVATQLAPQLAVLRNAPDGTQTMTLVVTPDSLGPVAVQVTITDGTLDMTLHGASEHGRHALTDALPDLRRDLEGAGLTISRLQVDADGTRGNGQDTRSAQQLLADARGNGGQQAPPQQPRGWAAPGSHLADAGPVLTHHSSASSGVDIRV
jgi:flagellar hook-length control protein FliK